MSYSGLAFDIAIGFCRDAVARVADMAGSGMGMNSGTDTVLDIGLGIGLGTDMGIESLW
jgi:hypothetical protein